MVTCNVLTIPFLRRNIEALLESRTVAILFWWRCSGDFVWTSRDPRPDPFAVRLSGETATSSTGRAYTSFNETRTVYRRAIIGKRSHGHIARARGSSDFRSPLRHHFFLRPTLPACVSPSFRDSVSTFRTFVENRTSYLCVDINGIFHIAISAM